MFYSVCVVCDILLFFHQCSFTLCMPTESEGCERTEYSGSETKLGISL